MTQDFLDLSYTTFFSSLKQRVEVSRYKAALQVNQELVLLYHYIGTQILKSQDEHGWGGKSYRPAKQRFKISVSRNERV